VFTYEGKPVFRVSSTAWCKDLKLAGIEDFRRHDLRHTWGIMAHIHVKSSYPAAGI
jgi:integrase